MKYKIFSNKAFTLIEILVVVLIIGILAAIAVPKYQKAVDRSRIIRVLPVVKSIDSAQQVFKLTTGDYSDDFSQLDILLPNGATTETPASVVYEDVVYWLYKKYSVYADIRSSRFPELEKYYTNNYIICWHEGNAYKKELCQTFLDVSCEWDRYCIVY